MKSWTPTDDGTADSLRDALQAIGNTLANIGQWAAGKHEAGFRRSLELGLIVQGAVQPDEAKAVALKMDRLMRELADLAAGASSSADTLAAMMIGEYLEVIHRQRTIGRATTKAGISVAS